MASAGRTQRGGGAGTSAYWEGLGRFAPTAGAATSRPSCVRWRFFAFSSAALLIAVRAASKLWTLPSRYLYFTDTVPSGRMKSCARLIASGRYIYCAV